MTARSTLNDKQLVSVRVGTAAGTAHGSAHDPEHAYAFELRRLLDGLAVLIDPTDRAG